MLETEPPCLSKPKRKFKLQEKLDYCSEWEKSGLSKSKFCQLRDISKSSFHDWYHQLYLKNNNKDATKWSEVVTNNIVFAKSGMHNLDLTLQNGLKISLRLSLPETINFIQELSNATSIIR